MKALRHRVDQANGKPNTEAGKVIMRKAAIMVVTALVLCLPFVLSAQEPHSYKPEAGYVPDAATAITIAEAVLIPIYGQKVVEAEEPFTAVLKDGMWTVEGTLHCPEGQTCLGGVAIVEISQGDGRIVSVIHEK